MVDVQDPGVLRKTFAKGKSLEYKHAGLKNMGERWQPNYMPEQWPPPDAEASHNRAATGKHAALPAPLCFDLACLLYQAPLTPCMAHCIGGVHHAHVACTHMRSARQVREWCSLCEQRLCHPAADAHHCATAGRNSFSHPACPDWKYFPQHW